MKRCSKCNETKSISLFGMDKCNSDHLASQCKECRNAATRNYRKTSKGKEKQRIYNQTYYAENKDDRRAYNQSYHVEHREYLLTKKKAHYAENRDKKLAHMKIYYATPEGKASRKRAENNHRERHPERVKARNMLRNAVYCGKIVKPDSCSVCGILGVIIHGHHANYSKPLEVQWVCVPCHIDIHKKEVDGEKLAERLAKTTQGRIPQTLKG